MLNAKKILFFSAAKPKTTSQTSDHTSDAVKKTTNDIADLAD